MTTVIVTLTAAAAIVGALWAAAIAAGRPCGLGRHTWGPWAAVQITYRTEPYAGGGALYLSADLREARACSGCARVQHRTRRVPREALR